MDPEKKIKQWLTQDNSRMKALSLAASLGLPDWCLAAGFVRNLVWDKVNGLSRPTPLNDIDLIYYDSEKVCEACDRNVEDTLTNLAEFPWSVKNQARMHTRNGDKPYKSTLDAMSYWPEVQTAVGVRLSDSGDLILLSPFGFHSLFDGTITLNPARPKLADFKERIASKRWLETWPGLEVEV